MIWVYWIFLFLVTIPFFVGFFFLWLTMTAINKGEINIAGIILLSILIGFLFSVSAVGLYHYIPLVFN